MYAPFSFIITLLTFALKFQPLFSHPIPSPFPRSSSKFLPTLHPLSHQPSHDNSPAAETLSWAVKLTFDPNTHSPDELDLLAGQVATFAGLVNLGQIGELRGQYAFAHVSHGPGFVSSRVLSINSDGRRLVRPLDQSMREQHYEYQDGTSLQSLKVPALFKSNRQLYGKANGERVQLFNIAVGMTSSDDNLRENGTLRENAAVSGHALETSLEQKLNNKMGHDSFRFYREKRAVEDWDSIRRDCERKLDASDFVEWHVQQRARTRSKRDLVERQNEEDSRNRTSGNGRKWKRVAKTAGNPMGFDDPLFGKQWHLINSRPGADINVSGVWRHNITGRGVTVAVIDDGLQWDNADLRANYAPSGSFDLNSNDDDPTPSPSKPTNHHGTRCAGEIAAGANNGVCGVGVAYEAKVAGIRMLDGAVTDAAEAAAFTKKVDVNDVYSCSWGPEDDGRTIDGPQHLALASMRRGIDYGRRGYGAVYVVASGNGGSAGDDCNYDGYANAVETVTVGAVDEDGRMPYYAEECASMLAVTYSSGGAGTTRDIVTTDWTLGGGSGCTESHSGTSAAAPVAAALIALMLEARPCLTWRDVQHIIALTATKVDASAKGWTRNAVGLFHSHQHGFGLLNAWRLVNTAKVWQSVPWMTLFTVDELTDARPIPAKGSLLLNYTVTPLALEGYALRTLEYVHAQITLSHARRGDLLIRLVCPSGTESIIGATRRADNSTEGLKGWVFSTVRCWGEQPAGTWTLSVTDTGRELTQSRGQLVWWKLILYGSYMSPEDIQERMRLIEEASSGRFLHANFQLPCQPPPVRTKFVQPLSEKALKMLLLIGSFLLVLSIYQTLEFLYCYDEEKEQQRRHANLTQRARDLSQSEPTANGCNLEMSEYTHLIGSGEDEEDELGLHSVVVTNSEGIESISLTGVDSKLIESDRTLNLIHSSDSSRIPVASAIPHGSGIVEGSGIPVGSKTAANSEIMLDSYGIQQQLVSDRNSSHDQSSTICDILHD